MRLVGYARTMRSTSVTFVAVKRPLGETVRGFVCTLGGPDLFALIDETSNSRRAGGDVCACAHWAAASPTINNRFRKNTLKVYRADCTLKWRHIAISGESASQARRRSGAASCHRRRNAGTGLRSRRRISAQHGRRAYQRRWPRALGRSLLLPDAFAGRAAVLGKVLRADARSGCARSPEVQRPEWIGALGM
jgi:hypothetical protein